MIINYLKVTNFRCHNQFELKIKSNKLAIIGQNATGKTSLLEAIYVLVRGKSFKTKLANLVKNNKDWYKIEAQLTVNDFKSERQLTFKDDKKTFIVNNQKSTKLLNRFKYPIVFFEPSDLNLLSGSPNRRRRSIDDLISQIQPEYASYLRKYNKTLKQRNNLLKNNEFITNDQLFSWNVLLAKYGSYIINHRLAIIKKINQLLTSTYQQITGVKDKLNIKYSDNFSDNIEQELFNQLTKNNSQITLFGPHRHDLIIEFNNNLASECVSRGETRSIVLSLKIIEAKIIKNKLKTNPLILLDDVLSELDTSRQKFLMNYIKNYQVIITTTDAYKLDDYQIIKIKS